MNNIYSLYNNDYVYNKRNREIKEEKSNKRFQNLRRV